MGQKQTIPFRGTVTAGSSAVLVSEKIARPFKTTRFWVQFELNVARTVDVRFFKRNSSSSSSPTIVQETDLFAQLGQTSKFRGDDQPLIMNHEVVVRDASAFLKVFIENTDGFDHMVEASVEVEYLD